MGKNNAYKRPVTCQQAFVDIPLNSRAEKMSLKSDSEAWDDAKVVLGFSIGYKPEQQLTNCIKK